MLLKKGFGFGGGGAGRSGVKPIESGPAESSFSNLELLGTVVGRQSGNFAIIEIGGKQELKRLGEEVGGAILVAIESRRAVLARGDHEQVLTMSFAQAGGAKRRKEKAREYSAEKEVVSRGHRLVPRKFLAEVSKHTTEILNQMRLRRHFQGGSPDGFLLTHIRSGSLVEDMGFLNGDVVRRVNSLPVTSAGEVISAYQKLRDTDEVTIEVERDNRIVLLSYQIVD